MRSKHPLRRFGAVLIFFLLWVGMGAAHYHFLQKKVENEAAAHNQPYSEKEFKTEWLADSFENHQSEYAQLFFQTLFIIALARWFMYKEEEDADEIKAELADIKQLLQKK